MNRVMATVAACIFLLPGLALAADDQRLQQMEKMIAAQQGQIAAQQAQIQILSRQVQQLIGAARATTSMATTMPIAPGRDVTVISPAQRALEKPRTAAARTLSRKPAPVGSGGKKASLTLSGHVNRAAMFYNDGVTSDLRSVDNDNSSTRVRLKGKVSPNETLTLGTTIEVEIESNSSRSITQDDNESAEDTSNDRSRNSRKITFAERVIELYVESKKFGKLSLGQGSMATDRTAEADLSGTKIVTSSDVKDVGGDLVFARRNGTLSAIVVDTVFKNMDGLGRADRIRYDTPRYQGLRASTSVSDGGAWDAAMHYGQKLFTFKVKAAAGYANMSSISASVKDQFSGSLSVLHNSGLNLTIAGAVQSMSGASRGNHARLIFGKLGYKAKLLKLGYTALSVDYGTTWDMPVKDAQGDSMAFAVVQKVTDWGTEIYLSFRRLKLDVPGLSLDNLDTVLAGARIKF